MRTRLMVFLALLALAPAASGQIIYRSTMPDGRTVLSDRPTPGAKKVEEYYVRPSPTDPPPRPVEAPRPAEARPAPETPAAAGAPPSRPGDLDAAIADLRKAEEVLRTAQAARVAAEEPMENERQGMVGGGSRLNDAYFERQKALDDSIDRLRKRVDDAQAKVNLLK